MALRTATPVVAITAVATGLLLGGTAYAALNTTPTSSSSTGSSIADQAQQLKDAPAGEDGPGRSSAAHDLAAAAKAATGSDDATENKATEDNAQSGTEDNSHQPATAPTRAASTTHGDDMRSDKAKEHAQDTTKRRSASASAHALHQDSAGDTSGAGAQGGDDAAEHSSATQPGDDHGATTGSDDAAEQGSEHSGSHGADD